VQCGDRIKRAAGPFPQGKGRTTGKYEYLEVFMKRKWKFFGIGIAVLTAIAMFLTMTGCPTEAEDVPKYTVTFVANNDTEEPDVVISGIVADTRLGRYLPAGGTVAFTNPDRPAVQIYSVPTGRRFAKWNTRKDGSGNSYYGDNRITQDLTLYAIWEGTYNLNHYWTRQLQYNSWGGEDVDGSYNYQLAIPVAELQSYPASSGIEYTNVVGQILKSKTFTVDVGLFSPDPGTDAVLILNRSVKSLKLQLYDGVAKKPLSNVIEKTNITQGLTVSFDSGDVFTTTDDATDASLTANQLLVSVNLNYLIDKITLFGTVKLTPGSGDAVAPVPNADVLLNFESYAHNSGNLPGIFADNDNAVLGVVQTDDFAYVKTGNSSSKALLVGHLTANTNTSGSLPKIRVNLPAGKSLSDYAGIRIKYMGLSGNSAAKTNVIMAAPALVPDNYSNAIATAANYETKKTIAAGNGVTQSGGSYNAYPYFAWNERTVNFNTTNQIQAIITGAGNSFDLAFGVHANAAGVVYLVDDIILTGKPAVQDDPGTTDVNEAYPGTDDFIVADFEDSPAIDKIGTGVITSIVELAPFATYTGRYSKVMFVLSNGTGAVPGLRVTIPAADPAKTYNGMSFNYFALNAGANDKTIAVKTGISADAAKAATAVMVSTGDASIWKSLSVALSISAGSDPADLFLGLGANDAPAGAIYLIDDITLHY
jgi:hypothetical protein